MNSVTLTSVRHEGFSFPGVVTCWVSGDLQDVRLVKLEIAPNLRGRGIGSRVLRELKRRYRSIQLVAYPDDSNRYEDCRRFYFKAGFVEQGDGDFVWPAPVDE